MCSDGFPTSSTRKGQQMINDKERRKVAARLRNQLTYMRANGEYYKKDLDLVECGNSAYRNIADSVEKYSNNFTGYYIPIVEKLADLIDRPTCTIVRSWQEVTPGLGELDLSDMCGFELSCGHEVQGYEKPKYCSECGAVVVDED